LFGLLSQTGDELDALLLSLHPFLVVGFPSGRLLHGVLPFRLLAVELLLELLHVGVHLVLEGAHLALGHVLPG
jgi:hypothetical protein